MAESRTWPWAEPARVGQFTLQILGEEAILIRHPDCQTIASAAAILKRFAAPWKREVVPSYRSLAVFLDRSLIGLDRASDELAQWLEETPSTARSEGTVWRVPCCYEKGPDLARIATAKGLSQDQAIEAHAETEYTIFAVGFQPGFPYAGWLSPTLAGLPRLAVPRAKVEAGSVGITGEQTGIYPQPSPGGWNLIGQTPCTLVDLESGWFAFAPGDRLRFRPIALSEWNRWAGSRPKPDE